MVVSINDVVKIRVTSEMIKQASYTAQRKAPNLANTWQERGIIRKYTDLYPGDLAVLAVEEYLKDKVPKIINYDVFRVHSGIDPEFQRPGKWDLLICDKFYIEVKSSLEKRFDTCNIEKVIKNRRIMCYPKREVQIHVQVYYILDNPSICKIIETSEFQSYDEANRFLEYLEFAYIMAWATRSDLGGAEVVELSGLTPIEVPRNYRNLYIFQGRPISELPKALRC